MEINCYCFTAFKKTVFNAVTFRSILFAFLFIIVYSLGYQEVKKEKPPFLPGDKQPEPEKKKIPQELLCHICEDLCVDAAIAPCCGTSFCDECKLLGCCFLSITFAKMQ